MYEHVSFYLEFHSKHLAWWIHHNTHLPSKSGLELWRWISRVPGVVQNGVDFGAREQEILGNLFFRDVEGWVLTKRQECIERIL